MVRRLFVVFDFWIPVDRFTQRLPSSLITSKSEGRSIRPRESKLLCIPRNVTTLRQYFLETTDERNAIKNTVKRVQAHGSCRDRDESLIKFKYERRPCCESKTLVLNVRKTVSYPERFVYAENNTLPIKTIVIRNWTKNKIYDLCNFFIFLFFQTRYSLNYRPSHLLGIVVFMSSQNAFQCSANGTVKQRSTIWLKTSTTRNCIFFFFCDLKVQRTSYEI